MNEKNLIEVRDRIAADNEGKWDDLLDPEEMLFRDGRLTFPRLYRAEQPRGLALTKWATAQVCQRLNIPLAYFRRCPSPLQDEQANHWLHSQKAVQNRQSHKANNGQKERDRWLLRVKHDVLRGALSERYTRLDNEDLLASLLPSLETRFEVGWFALTDESLHLRLIDPKLTREVLPGDRLVAGLHIANSEVGKRSVTVDAMVYRLVCQNGLVRLVKGRSLLHQRHVALTQPRMELALKNAVQEALIQSTGFMERLSWAIQQPISDVPGTLDAIAADWGLSQALRGKVQEAILTEPRHLHETLYGLVNGLTGAAQALAADDRYTLEALTGKLLESGPPRPLLRVIGPVAKAGDKETELSLFADPRTS